MSHLHRIVEEELPNQKIKQFRHLREKHISGPQLIVFMQIEISVMWMLSPVTCPKLLVCLSLHSCLDRLLLLPELMHFCHQNQNEQIFTFKKGKKLDNKCNIYFLSATESVHTFRVGFSLFKKLATHSVQAETAREITRVYGQQESLLSFLIQ